MELQAICSPVEAAIRALDRGRDNQMDDARAIAILGLRLDSYAFADPEDTVLAKARVLGCRRRARGNLRLLGATARSL
jgi:hypothetical protein